MMRMSVKQGLLACLLLSVQTTLRADSYQQMISAARGDELLQRQLELEARQSQLERKVQELEAKLEGLTQQSRGDEYDQRMRPRRIEVTKRPSPNLAPSAPPADYFIYPQINR